MSAVQQDLPSAQVRNDPTAPINELGPRFATRAAGYDEADTFVAENYVELKSRGVFAAGIPQELGGGGATYPELCEMLRLLARYCSSTALALAMHTHLVAGMVWRWRQGQPVEPFLRRIANEQLVLISTGASDWLKGTGRAERIDGGWRINARKIFGSGVPAGDFLITGAIWHDPEAGETVLHFPLSLKAEGVRVLDTWHALGMRGTGSHDVAIEDAFVPDSAVSARRPQGRWHFVLDLAVTMAWPIVYGVYLGIAEAARDLAIQRTRARGRDDFDVCHLVGEMENELAVARLVHADMVAIGAKGDIGPETTNRIMIGRTLVGNTAIRTVEKAMEVLGGAALYRSAGLERLFRDVQGARYHPLQQNAQQRYAGRSALGLDIDG